MKRYLNYADTTKLISIKSGTFYKLINHIDTQKDCITIVADLNTWEILGKSIHSLLKKKEIKHVTPYIIPQEKPFYAEYSFIEKIRAHIQDFGATMIFAVGSGTINDLAKRAAFECGCPYIVFATAASVDGYASDGAAIVKNGLKQTLPCPAPIMIFADPNIIARAPTDMSSAGFADLYAKKISGMDWMLADIVGEDPIDSTAWRVVHNGLEKRLKKPELIPIGNSKKILNLFEGLTASGIAMQYLKRSRAVSGTEHLLAHVWQMNHLEYKGEIVSHGYKVSLGTLIASAIYQEIQNMEPPHNIELTLSEYPSIKYFFKLAKQYFPNFSETSQIAEIIIKKYPDKHLLEERLSLALQNWHNIQNTIRKNCPSFTTVKRDLKAAGCPIQPKEIGLTTKEACSSILAAQLIRNRYTVLDILVDFGWMDKIIETISENNF